MRRSGLRMRPTARGAVIAAAAAALWVLAALTGITEAATLAAALLLLLAISVVSLALAAIGLRVEARVANPAAEVPGQVPAEIRWPRGAAARRLPLVRASASWDLPEALGGAILAEPDSGGLRLPVLRRGRHLLGPVRVQATDLFGLGRISRRIIPGPSGRGRSDGAVHEAAVIGLPRPAELSEAIRHELAAATSRSTGGTGTATAPTPDADTHLHEEHGHGLHGVSTASEPGVLARPYVTGDDVRRIHWAATARSTTLMTREDEPDAARSALIVLDLRAEADQVDRLIEQTLGVWIALSQDGWQVHLADETGKALADAASSLMDLQHLLALVAAHGVELPDTDPPLSAFAPLAGGAGLAVIVTEGGQASDLLEACHGAGQRVLLRDQDAT